MTDNKKTVALRGAPLPLGIKALVLEKLTANGYLQLWGPNASGTGQYIGTQTWCDYSGGALTIQNSVGQTKFQVLYKRKR